MSWGLAANSADGPALFKSLLPLALARLRFDGCRGLDLCRTALPAAAVTALASPGDREGRHLGVNRPQGRVTGMATIRRESLH